MNVLYSKQFDDVYFSRESGWAETEHVFLNGNNLPTAWAGHDQFTIIETGFGTGLNFFMTCQLFENTREDHQKLNFISFEKYPLSFGQIFNALEPWDKQLSSYINSLKSGYQSIKNGGEHIISLNDHINLHLHIGDINERLPLINDIADAWFLDGFRPASNPDMWSDTVFENMKRLSQSGTTFSTFTAAGFVRRALQNAGFNVQKTKGFGRKREMLIGAYP